MSFWKNPYISTDQGGWTTVDHSLTQHNQMLEMSGFPCKVLLKKTQGDEVGNEVNAIEIATWDEEYPANLTYKKVIWVPSDGDDLYPDTRSFRAWIDGVELTQVYNHDNITLDTEFYVVAQKNILGVQDNVALYLNDGLDVSASVATYLYTTISKHVNVIEHGQPSSHANAYRTEFYEGFIQYVDPAAKFRNVLHPHTITISFPATTFDTVYMGRGKFETHVNTCWTMGDRINYPTLKEFDIIYRPDLDNWYEIKNYTPNYIPFGGNVILATQSFEVNQLSPDDGIKDFVLK